jgi:hypothetical protein
VAAILKMAFGRNFSMSGHHYLPTYQILMILDNASENIVALTFVKMHKLLMVLDFPDHCMVTDK